MTTYDLSDTTDLKELCDELKSDFAQFKNLSKNKANMNPHDFHVISQKTGIHLTDPVSKINDSIDRAFKMGTILVLDKQHVDGDVKIHDIGFFISQFTAPLKFIMSPDIVSSIESLIEFMVRNCIIRNKTQHKNDVYKLRFPFRQDNLVTIMIFKFRLISVRSYQHLLFFNKTSYEAHIECISCVFQIDDRILRDETPIVPEGQVVQTVS